MALRVAFLASAEGSSARAIHEASRRGDLAVEPALMISNNSKSGALEWARSAGVPAVHLSGVTHGDGLDAAMREELCAHRADVVVLSGYAKLVGPLTVAAFRNRILNVHPAPLPRFGGQGMYGLAVHRAVLDARVTESAVTIHVVDEEYDHGPAVASFAVGVRHDDTPETLQQRVHDEEPSAFIEVLRRIADGELDLATVDR